MANDEFTMGVADWLWDQELQLHIPCCIQTVRCAGALDRKCGNGPLTGEQIEHGDCGEHG